MTLPLDGLRVVTLAEQYPGPFATLLLADLGADVVIVERTAGGDPTRGTPGFHAALARGKRSVALDLKSPAGRAALLALVRTADAVLEGYRPGTMERLGLGRDVLAAENPALVQVSISGFGQDGPYRLRSGHDLTYQAEAGMLYEHVAAAVPPPPPSLALGDLVAGLLAGQAVLLGLVQRGRTRTGTTIDVSMFDGLVSLLTAHLGPVLNGTGPPGYPYEPGYGVFATGDGSYLALGVAHEDHFWRALCDLTGLTAERDLTSPQRHAEHGRLRGLLETALAGRPRDEWVAAFETADVPYGRVRSLTDLPADPHVVARSLIGSVDGSLHARQPLTVDGVGPGARGGVPALGQHTAEVLTEAGLPASTVEDLLRSGAAVQH